MKKLVLVIAMALMAMASAFCTTDPPYAHYLLGYVDSATDFTVTILENVLPFDLEGSEVAYNSSGTIVRGLRVGTYTLISNSTGFSFYIAHTPLELVANSGSEDGGTRTRIDYRLYMILNESSQKFKSCTFDANASDPKSAESRIVITASDFSYNDVISVVNNSIYVSLDVEGSQVKTETAVSELKAGNYESTIYFLLEGN